jgi:hypothetical protein
MFLLNIALVFGKTTIQTWVSLPFHQEFMLLACVYVLIVFFEWWCSLLVSRGLYLSLDVGFWLLIRFFLFSIMPLRFNRRWPSDVEWNRGSGICRQFLPIRHPSCCSRLIPMVVISDDTGNNSYNSLKSILIWKIYISHTFPQALFLGVYICHWMLLFGCSFSFSYFLSCL